MVGIGILLCTVLLAQEAPPRPAFDVASVKPAASDGRGLALQKMEELMASMGPRTVAPRGNTVTIRSRSLLGLIASAYSVKMDEVAGPPWMAEEFFDVDARMPDGATLDSANLMLQSLLEERFGLKVHREGKEVSGYDLVVAKGGPKLKQAEEVKPPDDGMTPEERMKAKLPDLMKQMQARAKSMPAHPGMSSRTMDSATSAQVASAIAAAVKNPVSDRTGLTGKYQVVLETWDDSPDEPARTIFDAVADLGLKLTARKVTVDTLVVDHANRKPTEN